MAGPFIAISTISLCIAGSQGIAICGLPDTTHADLIAILIELNKSLADRRLQSCPQKINIYWCPKPSQGPVHSPS